MTSTILSQVPVWAWVILVALVGLGAKQLRTRRQSLGRGMLVPVLMTAVSLLGVMSAPGAKTGLVLVWAVGLAACAVLASRLGIWRGISWSDREQLLSIPGSWVPLTLFLGIFTVKFVAGVALGIHPELRDAAYFGMTTSVIYGGFSGLFAARGFAMWKAAQEKSAVVPAAGSGAAR